MRSVVVSRLAGLDHLPVFCRHCRNDFDGETEFVCHESEPDIMSAIALVSGIVDPLLPESSVVFDDVFDVRSEPRLRHHLEHALLDECASGSCPHRRAVVPRHTARSVREGIVHRNNISVQSEHGRETKEGNFHILLDEPDIVRVVQCGLDRFVEAVRDCVSGVEYNVRRERG